MRMDVTDPAKSTVADMSRYANSRHAYSWPRITAMMGDGKTKYDHDHDNEANEIAGCSVSFPLTSPLLAR